MLPFNMNDALRPMDATEGVNVALDTRLDNRVLDLRVRRTLPSPPSRSPCSSR